MQNHFDNPDNNYNFPSQSNFPQNPNLMQQGAGGLPGQNQNFPSGPQLPQQNSFPQPGMLPKVEQAATFEKPNPSSTQKTRTLRPQQQKPKFQTQQTKPVQSKKTNPADLSDSEKEALIKELYAEFEGLKNSTQRPGILNRMEELLTKILNLSS